MLGIIPIFAGLMACMPVPIGNPERSRVDADINGVWVAQSEGEASVLYSFQPYDKRTWLVTAAEIDAGPQYSGEEFELDTPEETFGVLDNNEIGAEGITSTSTVIYKVWLTKLGGVRFMTWEPVGGFSDEGIYLPPWWYVWRLDKQDRNHFALHMVNSDHDAFGEVGEAFQEEREFANEQEYRQYLQKIRPKWDRALKKVAKNFDDEDLYGDPMTFTRVPDELLDQASELFQEVIDFDTE